MRCPKCENAEIDESGLCPGCGYNPSEEPDLPQWRLDLSRRLREIKEKREGGSAKLLREDRMRPLPFPQPEPDSAGQPGAPVEVSKLEPRRASRGAGSGSRQVRRAAHPAERPEPPPAVKAAKPQKSEPVINMSPGTPSAPPSIDIVFRAADSSRSQPETTRNLVDEFIARPGRPKAGKMPPAPFSQPVSAEGPVQDGKLILLSRTLSGLIDLLFIFLWTVAFIVGEDSFSGIEIFDRSSILNAILLLLANYFLYSLFFLGTSNQTIGMMITNLHVVGESGQRPDMGRVALRCLIFLPSLLLLGAGLVWAFFDRESRCLHDAVSRTLVEPVGSITG